MQSKQKERAYWLADKIQALGDYAHEASVILRQQADEIERMQEQLNQVTVAPTLPLERECCGTFPRTPHRATCAKYRGKFKVPSNSKLKRPPTAGRG